jgi:hypothetical protein
MKTLTLYFRISVLFLLILITISAKATGPMNGTYTIGGVSYDYLNFQNAVSALKSRGVNGPVTFMVNSGTYTDSFTIAAINRSPLNSPITFTGVTGNPNDVMIVSNTSAVMILDSVSNISFNYIGFQNNSTAAGIVVDIVKGCDSITFNHCYLQGVSTTTTVNNGYQIVRVYDVQYSQCKNTDYLTFDSCSFYYGNCVIEYIENGAATPVYGEAIHITNCHFYDQKNMAFRLCGIHNAVIKGNYFSYAGYHYDFNAVSMEQLYGTTEFSNNAFFYSAHALVSLVNIGPGNHAVTDSLFFTNNMIGFDMYSTKSSGPPDTLKNITGINLYTMDNNNFLYNNTISITSRKSGKALWIYNCNYAELKNNIIINHTTSDGCALVTQYVDSLVSVNNDFYSTGEKLMISEGDTLHDLNSWKAAFPNYDSGSISKDVVLKDLHLTVVSEADQDLWKPRLSMVTTDHSGAERSIYLSCIGADERTLSNEKALLTFNFNNGTTYIGTINEGAKTISLEVPEGASLSGHSIYTNSTGSVVLFDGTVEKSNTVLHDFSSILNFMVVASDNTTTNYTVTTTLIPVNNLSGLVTDFSIFPNPTNGILKIRNSNISNLSIYSVEGTLVKSFRIEKSNIENTIDLTDLKTGLYFISDGQTLFKLIKQ